MNQNNQLHQIIQDIQSVIESKTINDEKKVIKIREIYNELKKKDKDELRKIFNIDAFKLIQQYINDCRSAIKKILLDIIELVAEKVIRYNNQFFNNIQSSGLVNKIELMIKDKIEEEKEQIKYSDETEQLIRIQIQIMKERESDQQMIKSYVQIIEKNINNLLNTINKLKEEHNKGNTNETNKEESKREIKQSSLLIKVCSLIREKDTNSHYNGTKIPDQIIKILKERIVPLIHINCPTDINCQQCINIPQSPALIELQSAVYKSLNEVSFNNQQFEEILVNYHNSITHITHPLIQFASQSQFNKKTDSLEQNNQQQSESPSSISFITSSLKLLQKLIFIYNNKCKVAIKTPKVLQSLTTLSIYKIGTHFSQENDQQTLALRSGSSECLWHIQEYCDESVQSEFVNAYYIGVLVIAISTASGHGEEYDMGIFIRLYYISQFISNLYQGRNCYATFPPQPLLARRSVEQIEEEGGNEEIDSQLINKGQRGNIKSNAKGANRRILNHFVEQGSTRPDWY